MNKLNTRRKKIKIDCVPAVYEIHCENGKVYIGVTDNYLYRIGSHFLCLLQKHHHSKEMQRDFNRLGMKAFSYRIIGHFPNMSIARKFEKERIESCRRKKYNKLHSGGNFHNWRKNKDRY